MPRIAKSVDSLLKRHSEDYSVSRIDETLPEKIGDDINRFRGVNKSKMKKKNNSTTPIQRNLVCSHCSSLSKLLKIPEMDVNHRFEMCPRKSSSVRLCVNGDDIFEGDRLFNKHISTFGGFQTPRMETMETQTPTNDVDLHSKTIFEHFISEGTLSPLLISEKVSTPVLSTSVLPITDKSIDNSDPDNRLFKITEQIKMRVSARKSSSPAIIALLGKTKIVTIIDEGAELSVLNAAVAQRANIPVVPTDHSANAAGSSAIMVIGQTKNDIIITTMFNNTQVPLYLGRVIVVPNLGCDMLLGEPAKQDNKLVTIAHMKTVNVYYDGQLLQKPYLTKAEKTRHKYQVFRISENTYLAPGDSIKITAPEPNSQFQLNHRSDMKSWFEPGFRKSDSESKITLVNTTTEPVLLKKNKPLGEMRTCDLIELSSIQTLGTYQADDNTEQESSINTDPMSVISIDPDSQLTVECRKKFQETCEDYKDLLTNRPGLYNGFYGNVNSKIDFTSTPPPNNRVYLPNYSDNMMSTLAKKNGSTC